MLANNNSPVMIKGSNGSLHLSRALFGLFPRSVIHGGPFRNAPANMLGVCLTEEMRSTQQNWLHMPIHDFSVPENVSDVEDALKWVFRGLLRGQQVYVGCAGGFGRTGLMLALVAKVLNADSPVKYVREHYHYRAVETAEQYAYVKDFDVHPIRRWLLGAAIAHVDYRFRF